MAGTKPNKTSFKKGQSGNPKGRPPKGETLTDILRKQLDESAEFKDAKGKKTRKQLKEIISQRLISLAMSGDVSSLKYIFDRTDGYPTQAAKVETEMSVIVKAPEPEEDDEGE